MKEIKVVIGKNFGDEGKGSTVHKLCKGKKALVVRHNGGAQAGHTVEEGAFRFVFHELGSGTLAGCPTYWAATFLPDLLKLGEEVEEFPGDVRPTIYAHPECACTVIYDVLLNSILEVVRGSAKHGSCGMGIYEATLRNQEEAYTLRLKDFVDAEVCDIVYCLRGIRDGYTLPRLYQLQEEYALAFTKPEVQDWLKLITDENVLWNAAEEMCLNFRKYVELRIWEDIKQQYDTVVFENAQGLMLDADNEEYFPHLTPSHTGLYNIAKLLDGDSGAYEAEIVYVTRSYVTRHGMGRLDYECVKEDINPHMIDKTNVPNYWQDSLRYGKHPAGAEFWKYLKKDLEQLRGIKCLTKLTPLIRVNHLDETENKVLFSDDEMELEEFRAWCMENGVGVM